MIPFQLQYIHLEWDIAGLIWDGREENGQCLILISEKRKVESFSATQDKLGNDPFPTSINWFGMRSHAVYMVQDGGNKTMFDFYII